MTFPFGKYKGFDIRDVPTEYLQWYLKETKHTLDQVELEIERRFQAESAEMSWVERIVEAGFRSLAKQNHPDVGGEEKSMRELISARAALADVLRSLEQ